MDRGLRFRASCRRRRVWASGLKLNGPARVSSRRSVRVMAIAGSRRHVEWVSCSWECDTLVKSPTKPRSNFQDPIAAEARHSILLQLRAICRRPDFTNHGSLRTNPRALLTVRLHPPSLSHLISVSITSSHERRSCPLSSRDLSSDS